MQWPANRFQQFPLRRAARPSAPELVFFRVHVFEADGFHLGRAPLSGFSFRGRSRHTRSNVIAQLGEVLESVRIHHPFTCNLDERRLRAILVRPLRRRPVVRPRRTYPTQRNSQCHGRHSRQNTSHRILLAPFAQTDSITVSDAQGMEPFPRRAGDRLPPLLLLHPEATRTSAGRIALPLPRHQAETRSPFVFTAPHPAPYTAICGYDETFRASAFLPPNLVAATTHRICHPRYPSPAARPKDRRKALREKGRKGGRARENREPRTN